MFRKITLMLLCLGFALGTSAQKNKKDGDLPSKLVVYEIDGKPEVITQKGKHQMKLREELTPDMTINVPFDATIKLFDEVGRKEFTIRYPGRGTVASMLKDKRNSVLKLTERYFDYVQAQLRGKGQTVSRRASDTATVTREIAFDSMYVAEPKDTMAVDSVFVPETTDD